MIGRTFAEGRWLLVSGLVLVCVALYPAVARADGNPQDGSVAPTAGIAVADTAHRVTPATAPRFATPAKPAGALGDTARPTMPASQYQAAKAAAAVPQSGRPGVAKGLAPKGASGFTLT